MNSDSKHGTCCQCPALMSDGRAFTSWEPRGAFSYRLGKIAQTPDNETLRYALQANPQLVNINESDKLEDMVCKGPQFFIDSTNFHKNMEQAIANELLTANTVVGMANKEYASF